MHIIAHENVHVLMARGYVDDSLLASSGGGVRLRSRQQLLMLADMNSVTTNDCRQVAVSCYRDLARRNFGAPEPAAISGNTS